jgi:hypothetical protein
MASVIEPNFASVSTPPSVKRHRKGCAGVREPIPAPFSTPAFVKRYRNRCASVMEPNSAPFPTPVFLIRQRLWTQFGPSLTLAPPIRRRIIRYYKEGGTLSHCLDASNESCGAGWHYKPNPPHRRCLSSPAPHKDIQLTSVPA